MKTKKKISYIYVKLFKNYSSVLNSFNFLCLITILFQYESVSFTCILYTWSPDGTLMSQIINLVKKYLIKQYLKKVTDFFN